MRSSEGSAGDRSGGPPLVLAVVAIAALVVMFVAIAVALLAPRADRPPGDGTGGTEPTPATSGEEARRTAALAIRTLGTEGIQVVEPQTPYRPPESPTLYATPRLILQAILPDDPTSGDFVIYELPTNAAAIDAAAEFSKYVASGVGRVQFPNDARFVLQRVGATLVFFTWSPANDPDPRTPDVARLLATVGESIPIAP